MEPQVVKKPFPLSWVIVILLSIIVCFLGFKWYLSLSLDKISPNILSITQPVTTIPGTISAISGNTISLKVQTDAGSQKGTIVYQASVTSATSITRTQTDGTIQNLKLSDLSENEVVQVTSSQDLRILKQTMFQATAIALPPTRSSFVGYVKAINGSLLTVQADIPPLLPQPGETIIPQSKTYQVTVTPSTQYFFSIASTSPGSPPQIREVALKDIALSAPITVYTTSNIDTTTQVTATKIAEFLGSDSSNATGSAAPLK